MLIGDVQGTLCKSGLLDKHDIISACCVKKYTTFGPFTLYRNVPRITELFRHLDSYYDSLNSQRVYIVDEWGGGAADATGNHYNRSMSKLLADKRDELNVNIHSWGLPFGYDQKCRELNSEHAGNNEPSSVDRSCGFCEWAAGSGTSSGHLTAFAVRGQTRFLQRVMFCHFQYGKKQAVVSLDRMSETERVNLLVAPRIVLTYMDGFKTVSPSPPLAR
jgi:hypothetical protein